MRQGKEFYRFESRLPRCKTAGRKHKHKLLLREPNKDVLLMVNSALAHELFLDAAADGLGGL